MPGANDGNSYWENGDYLLLGRVPKERILDRGAWEFVVDLPPDGGPRWSTDDARAVPVRALSVIFLVLLGAAVAEASQITGTLLVYALLVAPPATAQLLTSRPALRLALSPLIGLAVTWIGLSLAFYWPYPAGFFITMLAFAGYVAARLMRSRQVRRSLEGQAGGPVTASRSRRYQALEASARVTAGLPR